MDPTKRFSDRVENYVKFRPGYPAQVLEFLRTDLGLTSASTVVDVGSGTGISSELFLKNGNTVYCVEPNSEMRRAAEKRLKDYEGFISIEGTCDQTQLPEGSADFIVAAQAFHWFEPIPTKLEFQRILKKDGQVLLLWNERRTSGSLFAEAYENLIAKFSTDVQGVRKKNIDEHRIRELLGSFKVESFSNQQVFDFGGLLGRLLSSSYAPNLGHPKYDQMQSELKTLFEKHQQNGTVKIEYDTLVYYSKLIL